MRHTDGGLNGSTLPVNPIKGSIGGAVNGFFQAFEVEVGCGQVIVKIDQLGDILFAGECADELTVLVNGLGIDQDMAIPTWAMVGAINRLFAFQDIEYNEVLPLKKVSQRMPDDLGFGNPVKFGGS